MTTLNEKATILIQRLKTYNEWRRGAEIEMPDPKQLGEDIDEAIRAIDSARWRDVNVEPPSLDVKILIKAIDGEVRTGSMINPNQFSFDGDSNFPYYTVGINVEYCGGLADIVAWRIIETI